jgi:hypothetical protein
MYPYSKGYGYWCWKPPLIKKTLDMMNDGDIFTLYRCRMLPNPNGKERLAEFMNSRKKPFRNVRLQKF